MNRKELLYNQFKRLERLARLVTTADQVIRMMILFGQVEKDLMIYESMQLN